MDDLVKCTVVILRYAACGQAFSYSAGSTKSIEHSPFAEASRRSSSKEVSIQCNSIVHQRAHNPPLERNINHIFPFYRFIPCSFNTTPNIALLNIKHGPLPVAARSKA